MVDIDTMPAGHEMDALVAERVMGWTREECIIDGQSLGLWFRKPGTTGERGLFSGCPHYSTDIKDAWAIVEKLRDMWTEATEGVSGFYDDFPRPFNDGVFFEYLHRCADRRWPWAFLYVTPVNICRAALRAMEAANG